MKTNRFTIKNEPDFNRTLEGDEWDETIVETTTYDVDYFNEDEATNKLGQLEDWEDLYGIDLLTLLKTEEVYWRIKFTDYSGYSDIQKSYKCYIDLHNHQLIVYSNEYDEFGYPLPFEEYGNTWALDKHTLEKGGIRK